MTNRVMKKGDLLMRRMHRYTGLLLFLPFLAWAATGLVFFIKPGYAGAYHMLSVKTYPLKTFVTVPARPEWTDHKIKRTILGAHLLVKTEDGWKNLDPKTLKPLPVPGEADITALLNDAFTKSPSRYGKVSDASGNPVLTQTGVSVTYDWNTLSLRQSGSDTRFINWLYKVHYIQWTGLEKLDRVFGLLALAGVVGLALVGVKLSFAKPLP